MENNEEIITKDDKLLSLLCHLSMIMGGILVPVIIWAIKKEQSKFVRFHSLQAIFYHIAYSVIAGFFIAVFMIAYFSTLGIYYAPRPSYHTGPSTAMIILLVVFILLLFLIIFGAIGYAVYLAIKSNKGEKIKIPVIGKIIFEKVYGKG
ncbi:MAG: DUF4870 domain-containing protein [Ignavibacteriae bacterium]|nr:DUF4870 domain-containing protein [Ignavibacteriota bacterium]